MVTVKSVRQSKKGCKDRRKVVYCCDVCGTIYEVKREAEGCEAKHE